MTHKKLNKIPDEERKPRRKRSGPIESKNSRNFYVENLLRKKSRDSYESRDPRRPYCMTQSINYAPVYNGPEHHVSPITHHVTRMNSVPCISRNVLLECSILQNLILSDLIVPNLRNR